MAGVRAVYEGLDLVEVGVVVDVLDEATRLLETVDKSLLLVAVAQDGENAAVGIELANHGEGPERSATVDVDFGLDLLVVAIQGLLGVLARQVVVGSVADGTAVAGVGAVARKLVRVLGADARVLAGVGVAPVDHLAGVEDNFVLAAVLVFLPIGREFVVTVDLNDPHATDESSVVARLASDEVQSGGQDFHLTDGLHGPRVDVEDQGVLGDGEYYLVPLAVVEVFVEVVQGDLGRCAALDVHLEPALVQVHLDVASVDELVVEDDALVLVGSEGQGYVHRVNALVTLELGVRGRSQEGYWYDRGLRTVVTCLVSYVTPVLALHLQHSQLFDHVGLIEEQIFNTTSKILIHDETLLLVRHTTNVERSVQIQPREFSLYSAIN